MTKRRDEGLFIEYLSVDQLTPYERNARKHDDVDIEATMSSIKQFGFRDPIGVWGKKNIIVEGHGRLEAAKRLGMTMVPVIRLDDMSDKERKAYALAHNKTAEMSAWDFETLTLEMQELEEFDLGSIGFTDMPTLGTDELDKAFEDRGEAQPKKAKMVICPFCGKEFEP